MGASAQASSAAANLAHHDVNQSLPGRMEKLAIQDHKAQQRMQENLDNGSPGFASKNVKMFENLANNQKFDPLALKLQPDAMYSGNYHIMNPRVPFTSVLIIQCTCIVASCQLNLHVFRKLSLFYDV